jgi:hypothetical protein
MNVIWHLVKKDLRRLCPGVALLSLLIVGQILLYAAIAGLFRAPDVEWLNRLQEGPELLLRGLTVPLITYVLVGRLVFEDSPVEKDAHWITRPISGLQMFTAKWVGACLMFVLLPLALNVPWWLACGLDWPAVARASAEQAALNSILVALGLMCAALTGGFPRFVLWSLVGLGAFATLQIVAVYLGADRPELLVSRLIVWSAGGAVVALGIAGYQFATRYLRNSLAFSLAGALAIGALGAGWRWNLTNGGWWQLAPGDREAERLTMTVDDGASYRRLATEHRAEVTLGVASLPARRVIIQIIADGEWAFGRTNVWHSRAQVDATALRVETLRRVLLPEAKPQEPGRLRLSMPFPERFAQRAAHEPLAFKAKVFFDLYQGTRVANLPLRPTGEPRFGQSFAIWDLSSGPQGENRSGSSASARVPAHYVVSIVLAERSLAGLLPFAVAQIPDTYYALVNRRTGEFFLIDWAHSGPLALATLSQVQSGFWHLVFPIGPAPVKPEELDLAVVRLRKGELISRDLDIDPVRFAEEQLESLDEAQGLPRSPTDS